MQNKDVLAIFVLFLLSFYLYSLPLKASLMPFGEGDAAHKFGLAEWIYESDRIDREVPFFYGAWYAWLNKDDFFRPPNPLPYQINIAISRLLTPGERFLGMDTFFVLCAAPMSCIALYFVFRRLYNIWVGFLSSLLLMTSLLIIMPYLWGQRPHLISISFCLLIMYCFFVYIKSYLNSKEKPIYLYIAVALVAGTINQMQMLIWLGIFLAMYSLFLVIKNKRLPFSLKHGTIAIIIASMIALPFVRDLPVENVTRPFGITQLNHLFFWFKVDPNLMNQFMYQYDKINGGYWTLPLLLIGLAVLLFRREDRDIFTLFILSSLYVALHLYILNFVEQGRAARVFYGTVYIFYPIIALGVVSIPSAIPQLKKAKPFFVAGFIAAVMIFNFGTAYTTLKESYPPITRITNEQLDLALWVRQNIPDDKITYAVGSLTYAKMRFINMISEKTMVGFGITKYNAVVQDIKAFPTNNKIDYILLDYSDYYLVGANNEILLMNQFEAEFTRNASLLYNKNEIRVYKLEN